MEATAVIAEDKATTFKLKTADILLTHTKASLWGWLIRKATRCYWNHALIVCSVGNPEEGAGATLIIDPKTSGGVEVDYAERYMGRLDKYDVAVKRLEADWFQDDSTHDEPGMRSRICNIALNEVEIKLGSRLGNLLDKFIRQMTLILRFLRLALIGAPPLKHIVQIFRPSQMKAFACSGFVQWCYYQGVARSLAGTSERLDAVLFNLRVGPNVTAFELLTTTPADLAESDKLRWKYVIKDGILREVGSAAEVASLTA